MTRLVSSVQPLNEEGYRDSDLALLSLPIRIDNPRGCSGAQPITLGVPLPCGAVVNPRRVGLLDDEGRSRIVQTQPLAHWSDGSVKWLLVDFVLGDAPPGHSEWKLRFSEPPTQKTQFSRLRVKHGDAFVAVETGVATFELAKGERSTLHQVVVDERHVLDGPAGRILLTNARGQRVPLRVDRIEVEVSGPVRATVRLDGRFPGKAKCRFVARASFFADTGLMRLTLTIHNPRRARHKGGLWDLGDPFSLLFRELALELSLRQSQALSIGWVTEDDSLTRHGNDALEIYQDSSGGENWRSRNHVNRHGQVPCSFRGYRARCGNEEVRGYRASPRVAISDEDYCLTAALPEFWQQFPKAMEVRDGLLRIGLFPSQFGDLFELQGGEQKTHTVWLEFEHPRSSPAVALNWVHNPVKVQLDPRWYARSGAVPLLAAASASTDDQLHAYLTNVVQGSQSWFAGREIIDEYGWRNFGEVYANHEGLHYHGPAPVISHFNNQYDQVYGTLLEYWRTGDPRWFELGGPLARHVIDIDIYHTEEDRAAYSGGMFWFTDHYLDAATSTHRTYSRANRGAEDRSYGGGPCCCHNYTTGLLHYYYHTGEPLARQAVLGLANWVVRVDDGRRNVLGLIDDGPSGLASASSDPSDHGPGRAAGLSINALIDGWLLSGRRRYLEKAEELIRRCVHPADNIEDRDLLILGKRWSYTIFFTTLARYLQLKAEAKEIDFMYAYAQSSLIHYASWMLDNERPYFDRCPSEPWPAQELRKANVMRLAASHADEPLRRRLLQRARELADRAWSDLQSLASRYTARTAAIMLVEGAHDNYFRTHTTPPAPLAPRREDFGMPAAFVPQKLRVFAQLKTLSGLGRVLLRLANPIKWQRMIGLSVR